MNKNKKSEIASNAVMIILTLIIITLLLYLGFKWLFVLFI
jgi:hypothetical protein